LFEVKATLEYVIIGAEHMRFPMTETLAVASGDGEAGVAVALGEGRGFSVSVTVEVGVLVGLHVTAPASDVSPKAKLQDVQESSPSQVIVMKSTR